MAQTRHVLDPKFVHAGAESGFASAGTDSMFTVSDRVFHQKFGNGIIVAVDANKLTIRFCNAREKRMVDSFVERV